MSACPIENGDFQCHVSFQGCIGHEKTYHVIQGGAQNRLFPLGEIARLIGVSYNPSQTEFIFWPFIGVITPLISNYSRVPPCIYRD